MSAEPSEEHGTRQSDTSVPNSLESAPTDRSGDYDDTASYHAPDGELSVAASEHSGTPPAPSMPALPRKPPTKPPSPKPIQPLRPGAKIDDFEVISVLGRGAFGVVYLARQISLDRRVALKVTSNTGSEGRTMARLEHDYVVQVFSETVDPVTDKRLLCMQLVPGTSLQAVIAELHKRGGERADWSGADLLAILHGTANLCEVLDPSALHDRQALEEMDDVEATAWIGARLAEALDFAHHQGVLHRDIKPANVLVNQYGRPMLADFNIAQIGKGEEAEGQFGGTLPYMAPEHLDAFNPSVAVTSDVVDERSDIYSLGVVLFQLLTGEMPFPIKRTSGDMVQRVRKMAEQRRETLPTCCSGPPDARKVLEQTICQCLMPEPEDRYANGAELAEALDGCRRLRQAERRLPKPNAITRAALRRPFRWLILFALLPQAVGSIVNIAYNNLGIIKQLDQQQETLFWTLVTGYNAIIYPLVVIIAWVVLRPVWRAWRAMSSPAAVRAEQVDDARRRAVTLPVWAAGLAIIGWLPGAILFPAVIDAVIGLEDRWGVYAHFLASFALSALIAFAYSYCGVHYIVLRVFYPHVWRNAAQFEARTRRELKRMPLRHTLIALLAGSIPLLAAMLFVIFADEGWVYRLMVFVFITMGLVGFLMALTTTRRLSQTLVALTGTEE